MNRPHDPYLFAVATTLLAVACGAPSSSTASSSAAETASSGGATLGVFTADASGFDTHTLWYDTGREVVVFDAQLTEPLARQAIAKIHAATPSPIRYVVITHPNPDKFNGVGPFREEGATIVASAATATAIPGVYAYKKKYFVDAKMFTDETYPPQASVDLTFTGDLSLPLDGDGCVELHELANAGVSSTQTVAYMPKISALVVGDLIHVGTHAWLEGGIVDGAPRPDLEGWKAALDELLAYDGATVFGGRGDSANVADAVAAQKVYLDGMRDLVTAYVGSLADKTELTSASTGDDWQRITTLATQAYPDLRLSYLVTYGVYGLALQIAGE